MFTEMGILIIQQVFKINGFIDGAADHVDHDSLGGKPLIATSKSQR
jgi:hypothetical protein